MSTIFDRWLDNLVRTADAELPQSYREDMRAEGRRVFKDIMSPRGLDRRHVLVVGGAGYIGSPLTENLLSAGYRVTCLDHILYGNSQCVANFIGHPDYRFVPGDLADPAIVEDALDGVSDVVILAGLVGDPITKKYPEWSGLINDDGIQDLVRSLNGRGLARVLFISTCSNYGEIPENITATEDYELKPLSLYAKSKVGIETMLLGLQGRTDYTGTILRFATAFGLSPRMRFDLSVSEFTREMFLGRDLEVYDADTWRPYCHVRDFARAIRRVLEAPVARVDFKVFNAGGDRNNFTKQMIVDTIKAKLPNSSYKIVRGGMDRRNYKVDFSRIRETLYFEPRYSVEDGVAELIDALSKGLFADAETNRNFYGNYEIDYAPAHRAEAAE